MYVSKLYCTVLYNKVHFIDSVTAGWGGSLNIKIFFWFSSLIDDVKVKLTAGGMCYVALIWQRRGRQVSIN